MTMGQMITRAPPLRFTADDAVAAQEDWGFNCGPAALAAVLGLTPADVRDLMSGFESKGYTNPSMMFEALGRSGVAWTRSTGIDANRWPVYGLARIQWHGPWTAPGVPARVAYRHTHWVGAETIGATARIFDVNALVAEGWIGVDVWAGSLVPWLLAQAEPKSDGHWSITHAIEVTPPGP